MRMFRDDPDVNDASR